MSPRLTQYWLLWRAALGFTRAFSPRLLLLLAVFTTLVSTGIAAVSASSAAWLSWALCPPAGFLLLAWALGYLPGALKLNTPANAQLVPGLRRRLVELTLLVWLLGIAILGAGMLVTTKAPGPGLWLAAFLTLGVAGMTSGIRIAWLIYLPLLAGVVVHQRLPPPLLLAVDGLLGSHLALALLAPLGALMTLAIFPQAGKRHWDMLAKQAGSSAFGARTVLDQEPGRFSWDGLLLRRALAQRRPDALLMRALGRSLPAAAANGLAFAALGIGAVIYLAQRGLLPGMTSYFAQLSWVTISGVLLVFVFQAGMAPAWLARTTGEQALVRLAPAFPAGAAGFNELLARAQLRQSLTIWLMASGAALMLGLASGMEDSALWQQAGVCCMTLPTLALALRDHARSSAWPIFGMWAIAFALSYIGPMVGIAGYAAFGLPFWPVALITAFALTAVLVVKRLRLMRAAPIAFPAGRLN